MQRTNCRTPCAESLAARDCPCYGLPVISSRRREQRAGAAFVAAVVLLCQAAAWVHAAAIPHVTCLEHGESVHLATPGQQTAADEGVTVAAAPTEDAAHAHEHCNLPGHRTTRTPTPALAEVAATFVVATAPVAPPARQAVCILRLAPKTSPPRAPVV